MKAFAAFVLALAPAVAFAAPKPAPATPVIKSVALRSTAAKPAPAKAYPDVVLTFRQSAEVRADSILLKDVAEIECADAGILQSLESIEVGASPLSGRSRTVSAAYTRIKIRQLGVDLERIEFGGPAQCAVSRPEQILSGSIIEKAACEAVKETHPDLEVQAAFTPADVRLPIGEVETKPLGARLFGGTSGTINVQVLVDGRQQALVTVSFRLVRKASVLVATRDLPQGTVVGENDVRMEERPVIAGPLMLSDVSLAVGQQAAVPIKGGAALNASMLKMPVVIKRGARIKLICKGKTLTVVTAGEALQDAIAGQPVRVRNLTSLQEVVGSATGPLTVEVPF